ncbi:MAG: hypothetical protein COA79_03385 [Planctomycetota bacterium]|nr:MAG: hypothetical protein COA79_03385 [Planctomycetota bacterium]
MKNIIIILLLCHLSSLCAKEVRNHRLSFEQGFRAIGEYEGANGSIYYSWNAKKDLFEYNMFARYSGLDIDELVQDEFEVLSEYERKISVTAFGFGVNRYFWKGNGFRPYLGLSFAPAWVRSKDEIGNDLFRSKNSMGFESDLILGLNFQCRKVNFTGGVATGVFYADLIGGDSFLFSARVFGQFSFRF